MVLAFYTHTLSSILEMDKLGVVVQAPHWKWTQEDQMFKVILVLTIHETISKDLFNPHYNT